MVITMTRRDVALQTTPRKAQERPCPQRIARRISIRSLVNENFATEDGKRSDSSAQWQLGGKNMDPTAIIIWLIIGAIAGWLAGLIMKGGGFGLVGDIIVGIVGAFIAGELFPRLGIDLGGGIVGAIIAAIIGACILLLIVRLVKRAT
jgi:uncharacterized membrane protein YeaQ/YmgE (transglycosylase-associated protein family)